MSLSREENIYMTKVAEQTERFEDMLEYIKKVVTGFDQNFQLKKEIFCQLHTRTQSVQEELLGELSLALSKKKNLRDQKIFSSSKTSRLRLKKNYKSSAVTS